MRTLLIDNYDSFTYNLYQLLAQVGGELPLVVKNDELEWAALQSLSVDNVVISPGPGRPDQERDFGICARIIQEGRLPVLGVCLGHQGIAHVFGGRVVRAPVAMHGRLSPVRHTGSRLLEGIPSPFEVVRYHSLAVTDLPPVLRPVAHTDDGVIMALEHASRPIFGVQFHPESICARWGERILQNFARLTEEARPGRRRAPTSRLTPPASSPPPAPVAGPAPPPGPLRVHHRVVELFVEPARCFEQLLEHTGNVFWLDSSLVRPELARFSFMGDDRGPLSHLLVYHLRDGLLRKRRDQHEEVVPTPFFEHLARELARLATASDQLPFAFNGGYVGYIGYEMKAECGTRPGPPSSAPDVQLLFADRILAFDHQEGRVHLVCLDQPENQGRATAWLEATEARLRALPDRIAPPGLTRSPSRTERRPTFALRQSRRRYLSSIRRCQEAIAAGESYEVCLTNRVSTTTPVDPIALYLQLRTLNPAPYAAYLGYRDLQVACSSPERFLKIDRDRVIESKPIKGTERRGHTRGEDLALKRALASSEKNRSESLMIVDLVRNDLGKVSEVGSVQVPRLMDIESYATVHQMVSTVRATLRPGLSAVEAFRAAFPGGSMTGAPKLRTMEIIEDEEQEARGVYSGAIGYFALGGTCDFNIVIRTVQVDRAGASIGAGGAIVALSSPEEEVEEMLLKTQAPLRALLAAAGWPSDPGQAVRPAGSEEEDATTHQRRLDPVSQCH